MLWNLERYCQVLKFKSWTTVESGVLLGSPAVTIPFFLVRFAMFCLYNIIGRWGLQQIQMKTKQLKHHRICLNIHFVTKKFMTRKCAICTNTVNSIQIFSDKSTAAVNLMKISNIQTCGWARVANAAFPWRTFKNFNLT